MILGTHNSATGGKLLWWLKPLAWLINLTSKCQDRMITDQLGDGVKVFNIQIAKVNKKWRFTHGLAVYKEDVWDTLKLMRLCASVREPIYFQLHLNKCLWCKQDIKAFAQFVQKVKDELCTTYFIMKSAWVEGSDIRPHVSDAKLSLEEHYWTKSWAKLNAKSWIDKLPLSKRHAKKYNNKYKKECTKQYLMLDFYDIDN